MEAGGLNQGFVAEPRRGHPAQTGSILVGSVALGSPTRVWFAESRDLWCGVALKAKERVPGNSC